MVKTERAFTNESQSVSGYGKTGSVVDREGRIVNLSTPERWVTALGGGALAIYGLIRRDYAGAALALVGGGLMYWGVTGHCDVYDALRINTSSRKGRLASVKHRGGIKVEKSITINKPPEELYKFWRQFENLPRFMSHLESVTPLDVNRYRWVAKAPAGMSAEWDAEIYNEEANKLISWRSLEGSQIPNAGSVIFEKAPAGRGTEVKVEVSYAPPGGRLGSLIARLFGEEPEQQIEEDLRRFKQIMEAGEVVSVEGQSSGRAATSKTVTTGR